MKIKHVAVIMDGNGRWAELRGLSRIEGHREGIKRVNDIIDEAVEQKLKALTLYTFSMENWNRPKNEVDALMRFLRLYLKKEMKGLAAKNIIFRPIGNLQKLPAGVQSLLRDFQEMTKDNTGLLLTSALSYGGRDEIVNAVRSMVKEGLPPDKINEKALQSHLYTDGLPDPDLIIRTSGEMRLSNFLIWQSAYAEFYFTETLWPDFSREEFRRAIAEYAKRERRFGALPSKN
ncbi:MAG: isoprenyl transferase [Nitrospirae bacterium]|nr:isoprenyl transferase [Nitrospirota bacterium]